MSHDSKAKDDKHRTAHSHDQSHAEGEKPAANHGHGAGHGHGHGPAASHGAKQQPDSDAAALEQRIAELTEALQRERADALNLRRRHEEDLGRLKIRLKADLLRELLPVIDNLERALKHVPDDLKEHDYAKGVQGVVRQFEKTLADIGVERIGAVGEAFDPRYHEAVSMEDGDGTDEVVAEELQAGYRIGDDVIRHAMVKVRMQ